MTFEQNIKNWVSLNNQIKQLNEKVRVLKSKEMKHARKLIELLRNEIFKMPLLK